MLLNTDASLHFHRTIESLRLEKTSKTMKSSHQHTTTMSANRNIIYAIEI